MHGQGKITYPDGGSFEGSFYLGHKHGKGVATTYTGIVKEGVWENNKPVDNTRERTVNVAISETSENIVVAEMANTGTTSSSADTATTTVQPTTTLLLPSVTGDSSAFGDPKYDEKHGEKEITYPDGGSYEGSFYKGKKHGKGVATTSKGVVKDGIWENNKLVSGSNQRTVDVPIIDISATVDKTDLTTNTDATPTTDTTRSTPFTTAKSVSTISPSVSSDSDMDLGSKLTHKVITTPAFTYTGSTLRGQRHGYGVCEYTDGDIYDGEWTDDKKHGQGKITYTDGGSFEGSFYSGQKHGKGMVTSRTGIVKEGIWENNKLVNITNQRKVNDAVSQARESEVVAEMAEAVIAYYKALGIQLTHQVITTSSFTYTGTTLRGQRHGYGVCEYTDGIVYSGEWRGNKQHGEGKITYADGASFEGSFNNGNRHGKGVVTTRTGVVKEGVWENNKLVSGSNQRTVNVAVSETSENV